MEKIIAVIEDESGGPPRMGAFEPGIRIGSEKALYDVYFTDRRIIAAVVFSTSDVSRVVQIGFLQARFKWKKMREERRRGLKGKTPSDILRSHPESFEVPYEKIQSVKLRKGLFGAKLEIEALWEGEVGMFHIPVPKGRVEEIGRILELYLPRKVTS